MITSMKRCVACDDLWPWSISSRSFDHDLENRVRSVVSTVLDGFFLYLAQMITIIRGCVTCLIVLRIWKFEFWQIFEIFRPSPWKKKSTVLDGFFPYLAQMIIGMRGCVAYNDLWPWPISSRSFGLGLENHVRAVASSAAEIRSPGRQMRPTNRPGDPWSYHRWSVWRPMDSLGFTENVSEWKCIDDSTDALI